MKEEATEVSKISQSNALTSARYSFSLLEKRIVYKIIEAVRIDHIESKGQRTVFDNLIVHLDISNLHMVSENREQVKKAIRDLRAKTIEMDGPNGEWLICGFINQAIFNPKTNKFEMEISGGLLPHLVELTNRFTVLELTNIISLKSIYSQRLYEFCSMYKNKGYFFFEIVKLRALMKMEKKYENLGSFREKVLDVAQKEIKEMYDKCSSEFYFDYSLDETTKEGKKYTKIHFKVFERQAEGELKMSSLDELKQIVRDEIRPLYPTIDKGFPSLIVAYAELHPESIGILKSKLIRLARSADWTPDEKAKMLRTILKADFGITKIKKA